MKIVFFGSDAFSIKALEACLHSTGMELVLAVTTPAKKKGRGLKLESSEVFDYCQAKQLPVTEYPTLKDPKIAQELIALRPDIFVVASYGKLIPSTLLNIPKYRLNVHPSLLPKYRGSAPIHWPILNGDTETGVSIIDIAEKLDSGDIYYQEKIAIDPRSDAAGLSSELARFSYGVLKKVLVQVREGQLRGVPQNEAEATFARQLEKKDGEVSFQMSAVEIDRKVRGLQPWPGAYCFIKNERIALLETELITHRHSERSEESHAHGAEILRPSTGAQDDANVSPGTLLAIDKDGPIRISTKQGVLKIFKVKPEGKSVMTAADFARGRRFVVGTTF